MLKSSLLAGYATDLLIVLVLQLFTMPIYELPKKVAYLMCMTKLLYIHQKGREVTASFVKQNLDSCVQP